MVFHDQGLLSFACIYLVLSQLGAVVGDASQRMLGTKKALRFLSCYASRWPRFMPTSEVWLSAGWAHLHLHLRVLCAGKRYHEQQRRRRALDGGLRPSRVAGKLASLDGTADVGIVEQRFGLAVATTYTADLPLFTVLYLTDSGYRRLFVESGRPLDVPAAGRLAGVAVFLRILRAVLPLWERRWIESLNEVDNLVGVEVDDLFGPQSGSGVMFDGTSFARSRLYFAVLQTLRIFAEWIQESERELRRLRRDFDAAFRSETARRDSVGSAAGTRPPTRPFSQDVDGAWDEILEFHSAAANALADRIEKKNEEIKSFRDGLFSATSVREASRATSLNQYILVFTFVTIFYLPLSYVSSIFSMNTFAYQDAQTEQSAFLASTVLIAFVTWAVAAVVLWLVQDDARLPRVAARLRRNGAFPPGRREAGEKEPDPVFRGV
ncbi:hypothetical protein GGS23DRAFT_581856 [Durotheca rogersii]|uniref:uncharacterized protein n=1 Tax=Durotheca rogersii TaxID=419775 RepID=UPI0022200EEA|nr:uncharacterized protein GGS23DRAFT_581856 [Durotheca rogersii]KAI5860266.1 hypothetical protein GGS23DRAFT_581856 [Durotheca rogersii]